MTGVLVKRGCWDTGAREGRPGEDPGKDVHRKPRTAALAETTPTDP